MPGMESKRVYVGGLYHEATDKDLRQLFSKFGDVESIEIKKRSENNVVNFVFAYVNVKTSDPQITQCFRRLNGTFWKGKRLKLELARESFLAKLQREREQNRPAGRPPPPPPPPKRKTMQDRILDDVLSANKGRRSGDVGEGDGGGAGGVVDFTSEEPAPAPKPPAAASTVKLENGHDESHDEPKPKKKKQKSEGREREPSPAASAPLPTTMKTEDGEAYEPPPTRGALRMFGGIGGAPATPLSPPAAPTPKPAASTSSAPAPAAGPGGGDFLSRLEAFSSVWGDDGGDFGAMKSPAARRLPERPAATTSATPAPAKPVPAPSPDEASVKPAKAIPSPVKPDVKPAPAPVVITERRPTAAEDNEKRMASLRQKQEAFLSQKRALQLALSAKADVPRPNKRIVFDASDDEEDDQPAEEEPSSGGQTQRTPGRGGHSLFEEDEEEEDNEDGDGDDFRIRPQYEGAKGQKLQAMKARFGADDRFNLDERFADEDHYHPHEDAAEDGEEDQEVREEHRQQMDILHSVLGTAPEPERKGKKDKHNSDAGAVRFDPTDEAHAQYQLDSKKKKKKDNTSDDQLATPSKTSTSSAASASTAEAKAPTAAAGSAGTFYQVAPKLGDLFGRGGQASSSGGGGFSLLKMMGRASLDDDEEKDEEEEYKTSEIKTKAKRPSIEGAAANPFRYDSSSSEDEAEEGSTVQSLGVAAGGGGWQASKFFIQKDDSRLSEGLEWVRAAPSVEELQERAEKQRPELVELFNTQRHRRQRALQLLRGRGRGRRGHGR